MLYYGIPTRAFDVGRCRERPVAIIRVICDIICRAQTGRLIRGTGRSLAVCETAQRTLLE